MSEPLLSTRLRIAVGDETCRQTAARLGMNPETVRRHMMGRSPSAKFLAGICKHYGVLGTWLLLGEGPRTQAELEGKLLSEARLEQMLQALVSRLEALETRIAVIESRRTESPSRVASRD